MSVDLVDQIVRNVLAQLKSRVTEPVRPFETANVAINSSANASATATATATATAATATATTPAESFATSVGTENSAPTISQIHLPPETWDAGRSPVASAPKPGTTSSYSATPNASFAAGNPSPPKAPVAVSPSPAPVAAGKQRVVLSEAVITAELLNRNARGAQVISVSPRALITPAAKDWLRETRAQIERGATASVSTNSASKVASGTGSGSGNGGVVSTGKWFLGVISATATVRTFLASPQSLRSISRIELLGAGPEANEFTSGAICKAEATGVVLIDRSAARRACELNRSSAIRAAVVSSTAEVSFLSQDLAPNVYLIDPTLKSFMELRNLIQAISASGVPFTQGGRS